MSCPTSETINLEKIAREVYESLPKERLVEIVLRDRKEITKLRDENQALRQLVQIK